MKTMNYIIILLIRLFSTSYSFSQELLIPLNDDYEMEVQAAAYNSDYRFHTAMKSWSEYQFNNILNLDSLNKSQFIVKNYNRKWKNLAWNSIFNTDFIGAKTDDFYIGINPIVDFQVGRDGSKSTWVNTRGAEVKGTIGDNFAFYTNLRENQAVFPDYISEYASDNKVVP